ESKKAQDALLENQKNQLTSIENTLKTGFADTIAAIQDSFNTKIAEENDRILKDAENKLSNLQKEQKHYEALAKYGIKNDKDLAVAKGHIGTIDELSSLIGRDSDLASRKARILKMIDKSGGNLGNI